MRPIQLVGYGVLGFIGVGTTLDIFQNIMLYLYFEYGVLSLSGYGLLIFFPFVVFGERRHGYAISSLMDTTALGPERDRVINDLSQEDKDKYKAYVRATNILLQGLSKDIYKLINNYTAAKDIWDTVKFLLAGFELTKDERESQLYDQFEHFCQNKCETIHEYYVRFSSLINDMRNIKMTMSKMQLNSKFVNNMLPEWGRFVTEADQCDAFDFDVDEAPTTQTMFMANLLSTGPVYDEAGLSYNTDILSKVHDYDDYMDNVGEHQEVQEIQNNVQQCYVVETDVDYTSDSNMILPTFVEANYETLESLLRDRRRQMRNNNHRTELDYFSEDCDEEREMEPRPKPARAGTSPLQAASPNVRRGRERVVRFEETKQKGKQGRRNSEGGCLRKKHKEGIVVKLVTPAEAPILMVSQGTYAAKDPTLENMAYEGGEITFPSVIEVNNVPLVIEAKVFGRKVGRVYMDSGSSCEVIYEHCFEKLNSTIKASKVDLKIPLVGFSRECSWSVRETLLEITIGEAPLLRTKTLNFVIISSDSPHNMLLGRTTMQKIGIVVLTIQGAVKFYTKKGIETILSSNITKEGTKKARNIPITNEERILSCIDVEETIIINDRIPRNIMVDKKPFNTEHKLNEYSHIKPIKQKRGLGPDRNTSACKEIEELMKAGILRKGIKSNPSKVKVDTDLEQPRVLKDIQSLNGKLVSLSRFLSKGAGRSLPFFKVLKSCKGKKKIQWTDEADKAFKEIKKFVQSLPTLTAPRTGEVLMIVLQGDELNYPALEKLILALTRADFLLEMPFEDNENKVKEKEVSDSSNEWKLYTDRTSSSDGSRAGLILIDLAGKEYNHALRFEFEKTNNEAEYEALLAGPRIAQEMEIAKVAIFLDL
nr:reverse transcriptase domain-containing protein [Tanacetum cinerariifolium]